MRGMAIMKKLIMPRALIKAIRQQKQASVTLEAALIFPLIIIIFYLFYTFLIACSIQMTMKSLATSTVNSIGSQIYSVDKVGQLIKQSRHNDNKVSNDGSNNLEQHIVSILPEPIYTVVKEGKKGNWWPSANLATTLLGKHLIEDMLLLLPESGGLEKNRLSLVYLHLPDIVNYTDATVKLTLQYELPYRIPFLDKPFVIREQASQRAWLPDARSNHYDILDDDMFIQVVSITPNPVRPGHKAKIVVKTKPHASLDISITYKSGTSIAKNLEVQQANSEGELAWEWFVSGNTTPGLWSYTITEVGGNTEVKGVFEVRKKGS